jgi:hypothetical protein
VVPVPTADALAGKMGLPPGRFRRTRVGGSDAPVTGGTAIGSSTPLGVSTGPSA